MLNSTTLHYTTQLQQQKQLQLQYDIYTTLHYTTLITLHYTRLHYTTLNDTAPQIDR